MNNDISKLRHHQTAETEESHLSHSTQTAQEFESVEDLIRKDVQQTDLPPEIAERLNESIAREPQPQPGWWQRFFGTS
jgi:hypothetical protein